MKVSQDNAGRWYFGSTYLCRNTRHGNAYCLAVELARPNEHYRFKTNDEAHRMKNMCYPDSTVGWVRVAETEARRN
jgi:hypothetical protein